MWEECDFWEDFNRLVVGARVNSKFSCRGEVVGVGETGSNGAGEGVRGWGVESLRVNYGSREHGWWCIHGRSVCVNVRRWDVCEVSWEVNVVRL